MRCNIPFPFDLVMFDLDGTLVATAAELADAVNDTLIDLGHAPVLQVQVDAWIGHGALALLAQALAHRQGTSAEAVRQTPGFGAAAQAFGGHYTLRCGTRSRLYPGVLETLKVLRHRGVRLAVLTNKEARYTQRVLDAHGLPPFLDLVVAGDTLAVRKPDPAVVRHCLAVCGVRSDRALLVGDSATDVATARNAGVAVWAVPYGYNGGAPVQDSRPDRMIDSLAQLVSQP